MINARVPVAKVLDPITKQEVGDISVNNSIALDNSHFVRTMALADPRVRHLGRIVKYWAKQRRINDRAQGTLSTYALVLQVLYILQRRNVIPSFGDLKMERGGGNGSNIGNGGNGTGNGGNIGSSGSTTTSSSLLGNIPSVDETFSSSSIFADVVNDTSVMEMERRADGQVVLKLKDARGLRVRWLAEKSEELKRILLEGVEGGHCVGDSGKTVGDSRGDSSLKDSVKTADSDNVIMTADSMNKESANKESVTESNTATKKGDGANGEAPSVIKATETTKPDNGSSIDNVLKSMELALDREEEDVIDPSLIVKPVASEDLPIVRGMWKRRNDSGKTTSASSCSTAPSVDHSTVPEDVKGSSICSAANEGADVVSSSHKSAHTQDVATTHDPQEADSESYCHPDSLNPSWDSPHSPNLGELFVDFFLFFGSDRCSGKISDPNSGRNMGVTILDGHAEWNQMGSLAMCCPITRENVNYFKPQVWQAIHGEFQRAREMLLANRPFEEIFAPASMNPIMMGKHTHGGIPRTNFGVPRKNGVGGGNQGNFQGGNQGSGGFHIDPETGVASFPSAGGGGGGGSGNNSSGIASPPGIASSIGTGVGVGAVEKKNKIKEAMEKRKESLMSSGTVSSPPVISAPGKECPPTASPVANISSSAPMSKASIISPVENTTSSSSTPQEKSDDKGVPPSVVVSPSVSVPAPVVPPPVNVPPPVVSVSSSPVVSAPVVAPPVNVPPPVNVSPPGATVGQKSESQVASAINLNHQNAAKPKASSTACGEDSAAVEEALREYATQLIDTYDKKK